MTTFVKPLVPIPFYTGMIQTLYAYQVSINVCPKTDDPIDFKKVILSPVSDSEKKQMGYSFNFA